MKPNAIDEKELRQALPIGTILKSPKYDYRVEEVLGKGGFGITYKVSTTVLFGKVPIFTYFTVKEQFVKDACFLRKVGHAEPSAFEDRQVRNRFVV